MGSQLVIVGVSGRWTGSNGKGRLEKLRWTRMDVVGARGLVSMYISNHNFGLKFRVKKKCRRASFVSIS